MANVTTAERNLYLYGVKSETDEELRRTVPNINGLVDLIKLRNGKPRPDGKVPTLDGILELSSAFLKRKQKQKEKKRNSNDEVQCPERKHHTTSKC
jgi:hypothetical protein